MKYVAEFRDGALARNLAVSLQAEVNPQRGYSFMEFCGGHTHALARYGVIDLLPANVRMIHGPGCPVCVLPIGRIDLGIQLALERGVMLRLSMPAQKCWPTATSTSTRRYGAAPWRASLAT